jgi:hypothetical protein
VKVFLLAANIGAILFAAVVIPAPGTYAWIALNLAALALLLRTPARRGPRVAEKPRSGSYIKSAESRRMSRLANIPTVERRRAALKLLLERAK